MRCPSSATFRQLSRVEPSQNELLGVVDLIEARVSSSSWAFSASDPATHGQ